MEMNFEQAFSFVKNDPCWSRKMWIGGGLTLLIGVIFILPVLVSAFASSGVAAASIIIGFLINFILILALVGYPCMVANKRINDCEEFMPRWSNFWEIVGCGAKATIGCCLYAVPVMIAFSALFGIFIFAALIENEVVQALVMFLLFLLVFVVLVLIFIYMLACYLMMTVFAKDLKILSFINFKEACKLLKGNWVNYLILLLLIIAVNMIVQFAAIILSLTIIGLLALPWLMFYMNLINAELIAQFAKTQKAQ